MAEVLKHLTSTRPPIDMGPDQEDIDALQDDILANTVKISELEALVGRLEEVKVQCTIWIMQAACCRPALVKDHKRNMYGHGVMYIGTWLMRLLHN